MPTKKEVPENHLCIPGGGLYPLPFESLDIQDIINSPCCFSPLYEYQDDILNGTLKKGKCAAFVELGLDKSK